MKRSREDFNKMLENTTDMAKTLQLVFPDPRDALMSLALIMVGLAKSIEMPMSVLLALVEAINKDMHEDTSDIDHSVH
jgi:hypothetical protein